MPRLAWGAHVCRARPVLSAPGGAGHGAACLERVPAARDRRLPLLMRRRGGRRMLQKTFLCLAVLFAVFAARPAPAQTVLLEGARIIPGNGSPAIDNAA